MLVNIVIICLFQSTLALFYHNKMPTHNKIHVCLTPPNTMLKVQKHITECQHEVKTNIFNEAFSLINDHAFHHPDDHTTIDINGHDDFAHHNFTLTEKEILKFFEQHDNKHHHHSHGAVGQLGLDSGSHGSSFEVSPEQIEISHEFLKQPTSDPIVHYPNPHAYAWQKKQPSESFYKKSDAIQLNNNKPEDAQHRLMRALTTKQTPYTYFNVNTGEPIKNGDRTRRSAQDIEYHPDLHSTEIPHPTTASFKDKRIAGCLMHCLHEKNHAIDSHSGYPTLDGLVNFYSDGVHEHGFFMTTLRAVDFCLKGASYKYHINRHHKPNAGISCDLAFDIFDCVSDKITEYCSKHHFYHHDDEHSHKEHYSTWSMPYSTEHTIHHGHFNDEYHEYHDDASYYY